MRGNPALLTLFGTLGCLGFALGLQFLLFLGVDADVFIRALLMSIALPAVTGAVLFTLLRPVFRELGSLRRRYAHAIAHDSLTSCLNSAVFSATVEARTADVSPLAATRPGAFLVVDVDRLSALNSAAGHRAGDEALRTIAEIIRSSVRKDDIVGRLGGEEFGVFLPGATKENAESVAERIRRRVDEASFESGDARSRLTVSVGAVLFDRGPGFDDLLLRAEETLHRAKDKGRNRVEFARLPPEASSHSDALH